MTKELLALFADCKKPTCASSGTVSEQLRPILEMCALVQQQAAIHRGRLLSAELTAPNQEFARRKLERLHQKLGSMDTHAKTLIESGRNLALDFCNLERQACDIEREMLKAEDESPPDLPSQ